MTLPLATLVETAPHEFKLHNTSGEPSTTVLLELGSARLKSLNEEFNRNYEVDYDWKKGGVESHINISKCTPSIQIFGILSRIDYTQREIVRFVKTQHYDWLTTGVNRQQEMKGLIAIIPELRDFKLETGYRVNFIPPKPVKGKRVPVKTPTAGGERTKKPQVMFAYLGKLTQVAQITLKNALVMENLIDE